MIDIGFKFKTSGAVVLATAPVDTISIIVLARVRQDEYVVGRVYVQQLPHPEEWFHGDYYNGNLESAVARFMERAEMAGFTSQSRQRIMVAFVANVEKQLGDDDLGYDLADDDDEMRRAYARFAPGSGYGVAAFESEEGEGRYEVHLINEDPGDRLRLLIIVNDAVQALDEVRYRNILAEAAMYEGANA